MADTENLNLEITEAIVEAVSPTATVSKVGHTSTLTVTDKNGTTTAEINDGEKGDTGDTGLTPDFSIGTVQTLPAGSSATATITGTDEEPVLNLGLPKGDVGATPEFEIGEVETLGPGESATATITGTADNPELNLGIPEGRVGATPDLSIGTVTTKPAGSSAEVTITGTDEEPVLNFGIPQGAKGDTGNTGATGNGIASITETATSGSVHTYTITYTNGDTTTFDVTDGEVTNASLATVLEDYARTNGAYEAMTVGNAEQLVSNIRVTDTDPYLFRTAGGSLEIGDREYPTLVGASVAKNQLVQNGNFASADGWSGTWGSIAVANNILTYTVTQVGQYYQNRITTTTQNFVAGHKYLVCATVKGSRDTTISFISYSVQSSAYVVDNAVMGTATSGTRTVLGAIFTAGVTAVSDIRYGIASTGKAIGDTVEFSNCMCIDLTAYFGSSTIADYIYTLEQGTAGAGYAFCKKYGIGVGYTAYNAGTLQSTTPTKHITTGFNQWDEEWVNGYYKQADGEFVSNSSFVACKNKIRVFPNTAYYVNINATHQVLFYDANENFISAYTSMTIPTLYTTPANCYYITFYVGGTYGTTYNHDICINLHWDGERDGEYEPYTKHEYDLGNDTLRGIFELNNGELKANGDVKTADGTIQRKFRQITIDKDSNIQREAAGWGATNVFYVQIAQTATSAEAGAMPSDATAVAPIISDGLIATSYYDIRRETAPLYASFTDLGKYIEWTSGSADVTAEKARLNGNPITVCYELKTPTEEEGTAFQSPQIVSNWGTEEYTEANGIVVGHSTEYPQDLKAKVESAPNNPSADGDYIVKRENGENAYVPLVIPQELPNAPSTDGTYTLKCTVSSGTATYSWSN